MASQMANINDFELSMKDYEGQATFFDLPLEYLMVPFIAKHLNIKDILAFRCCSKYCKELAEHALAINITKIYVVNDKAQMAFPVIAENCRRLREITLFNLDWLNDEMVIAIFNNNPLLEDVDICLCRSLTPKALYPFAENCKKVTSLSLTYGNFYDETFLELLNLNKIHLTVLEISRSDSLINEDDVLAAFFIKQPKLQHIALSFETIQTRQLSLAIAHGCKDLHTLELQCHPMSFADLNTWRTLLDSCPIKNVLLAHYAEDLVDGNYFILESLLVDRNINIEYNSSINE